MRSFYAYLLNIRWRTLFAAYVSLFLLTNCLFACLYLALEDAIDGARPGSFLDAFSFSVQTISTIGFGRMTPRGHGGHVLVTLEVLVGMLTVAVGTGITFAKFARPTAGVLFSDRILLTRYDGKPCLMFRIANVRSGEIAEASLRATVILSEETREGHKMRRLYDLDLLRDTTPVFVMSWLVIHIIDEHSPIYGKSMEDFAAEDIRVIASMTGLDGTFMQTVYANRLYRSQDVLENHHFADIIRELPDGRFELNLHHFQDTKRIQPVA